MASVQRIGVPARLVGQGAGFVEARALEHGAVQLTVGGLKVELTLRLEAAAWDTLVRCVARLQGGPITPADAALLLIGAVCPICHYPPSETPPLIPTRSGMRHCPAHLL